MPHSRSTAQTPNFTNICSGVCIWGRNYGGARHKTTQRVTIMSPQVEAVPASKTRQDQEIKMHAALLRDEVFNIVPSTVNVT